MAIQGALPFSNAGAGLYSGGLAGLGASYANSYNNALAMNQSNYNNILTGYQQTSDALNSSQQQIAQGYGNLDQRVMSGIDQVGQARRNNITDQYAAASGDAAQSLTSRGLGNSTVVDSVNRGLLADRQKADTQLTDDLAQMRAGYQSNIGLSSLGSLTAANNARTDLSQNQLSWMNSVNAPYPDAGMYASMAQTYGAANAANAARAGGRGSMDTGVPPTGGVVTKGGHQFAPNSSIDWNAGSPPPVAGAGFAAPPPGVQLDAHPTSGGFVAPPGGGYGGAALGGAASQFGVAANALQSPAAQSEYPFAGMEDPSLGYGAQAAASSAMDWASQLPLF